MTLGHPAITQQLPKLTVRTDFLPWGMHAGLHLGVVNGWFREAGLDVEVSDGRGSGVTMQQVATGDVDIGWAHRRAAAGAIVKELTSVSRHSLRFRGSAMRTRNDGCKNHLAP
jgi:NitT/TauT family transport system substrate-binding protein